MNIKINTKTDVIAVKAVYQMGMINIDSDTDSFSFSLIEGMYKTGAGYGCQLDNEANRDAVETLCSNIAKALQEYKSTISSRV